MRQELMSWVRVVAVAFGAVAMIGAAALLGGPALELIAFR
jgi:hypothetical protein